MKNLNLNAMGVMEMNENEMRTTDGEEISSSLAEFLMRLENYEVNYEGNGTPAWL